MLDLSHLAGRMSKRLTHIDDDGRPSMVDVGSKPMTHRIARAEGWVRMSPEALMAISTGRVAKGDVLRIAELAGIQGAKRTADLIPLCHPLPVDAVTVKVRGGGYLPLRHQSFFLHPVALRQQHQLQD